MGNSKEIIVTKIIATGLTAFLGISATGFYSHIPNNRRETTSMTKSNKANPIKFPELVSEIEQDKLAWGKGPNQPIDGIAAYKKSPNHQIIEVEVEDVAKISAPKTYMPKPDAVNYIDVLVYPAGTNPNAIGIDAETEYGNSITKDMDTNGNTEKNVTDDQIFLSGITRPNYQLGGGPNTKNSYLLDVDGNHISVRIGSSAVKTMISTTKANTATAEMEGQALAIAGAAAKDHNVSFSRIIISGN
ncbi:MAG TPA: hypothetical protein VMQ52_04140 [Candidatus Saccharimonadales bacterium]|jgi:hypothetical protein|nr:hypothetical protein [Candidatus Saccharimonadales bacterium]